MREPWRTPFLKGIRTPQLGREEIRKIQRQAITDAQALEVVKAQRASEARSRAAWDGYVRPSVIQRDDGSRVIVERGAIAAAQAGDVDRLVDCLRAHKSLTGDDWGDIPGDDWARLEHYLTSKLRRRRWPKWLIAILWHKAPTGDDYERLADLIEQIGRRRGGVIDEPAHRAAKLAHALNDIGRGRLQRNDLIERACEMIEDEERCPAIDRERVHNLLDHPRARMNEPRRPKKQ